MQSRCYTIGWNMAADDLHMLPAHTLVKLAEDVVNNEFPRSIDAVALLYHQNEFIRGYHAQFASRSRMAPGKGGALWPINS